MAEDLEWRLRQAENFIAALKPEHEGVMHDLYGNGQPGLRDIILGFIASDKTREEERAKALERQEQNVKTALDEHNSKMNIRLGVLGFLLAVVMMILGILTYVDTRQKIGNGSLQIPGMSQSGPQNASLKTNDFAY